MKKIFAPAVSLMNRLKYPHKMALMALVFSLSLLTFMYMLIIEINADVSNLTLDPGDSFYLTDMVVNKLPLAAEYTGRLRGLGTGLMVHQKLTSQEKANLIVLAGLSRTTMEGVKNDMKKAFRKNPGLKPELEARLQDTAADIDKALDMLDSRVIHAAAISLSPPEYFDTFSQAIESIFKLHEAVTHSLNSVLQSRIRSLTTKKNYVGLFAFLSIAVLGYLFVGNYFSVMDSLSRLVQASKRMGSGDLNVDISLESKDEMELVADSFNDMAHRLAKAMEDLKRSNTDLEHFAFLASHDLKAPIISVGSALKLFQRRHKGGLDAESEQFIADAIKGTLRMEKLISALLAYSRVDTGKKAYEQTSCSDVLAQVLADLKIDIENSGAKITYDKLPKLMADPVQLGQLFQNLIGNAIKYRSDKPLHINITAGIKGKEWLFSVQDNGISIPNEHAEKIFKIFQRLHKDEYPGTGIGLAVCKKIVERHGGRIWVESETGKGSTFYFTIPVPAA